MEKQKVFHLKIFVKTLQGPMMEISINQTFTVLQLKGEIEKSLSIPIGNQRLIYNGHHLSDEKIISEYSIQFEDTLHVLTRSFSEGCEIYVQIGLKGKTIPLYVDLNDTVENIQRRIWDKEGIPPSEQMLLFGGKQIGGSSQTLADHGIKKESKLICVLQFRGGGTSPVALESFDSINEKTIPLGAPNTGPKWLRISTGLNVMGRCYNRGCVAADKEVWIQKKFGVFNIAKVSKECVCPCCNESVTITNCGFFKCVFSIEGKTTDEKELLRENIEAPDDTFLTFNSMNKGYKTSLTEYQYLKITTRQRLSRLPPDVV